MCSVEILICFFFKPWFFFWLSLSTSSFAFNLEENVPIIKEGPKHSLFGLSIKQHYKKENPKTVDDIVVLVGAPTAAASYHNSGSVNPGGLFSCSINSDVLCQRVTLNDASVSFVVNNSNSWTGVAVSSEKPGGNVAVCGHRFVVQGGIPGSHNIWEAAVGRCFLLDSELQQTLSPTTYEPCIGKVDPDGSYSQAGYGYCQAGTSFAFTQTADSDIIIGMPGVGHWTGAIFTIELFPQFFPETLYSFEISDNSNEEKNQNSYSGFAVATIMNFTEPLIISGAPRRNDSGQVIIYKIDKVSFIITQILSGETVASAFGYTLETVDVNGDGIEDLIVGAPQYYNREESHGGAVYLYINNGNGNFNHTYSVVLYGEVDSAFGNSITNIGDINKDGFNDIAVGAPGADNGLGKVYIYHGETSGIKNKPVQIIEALNYIKDQLMLIGFGYAVSGGLDLDMNGYPDLAVGTLSDVAFIFRSRPIIDVYGYVIASTAKVDVNSTAQHNPDVILIRDETTQLVQKVVSFNITACLNYTSRYGLFKFPVNISYKLQLDVKRMENNLHSRLLFVPFKFNEATKAGVLTLPPQSNFKKNCFETPVYLENGIQDKLSPFVISLFYDVERKNVSQHNKAGEIPSLDHYPVVNQNLVNTVYTQVNISKSCGIDDICTSNLQLNAEYVILLDDNKSWEPLKLIKNLPTLILGTEKGIGFRINISNPLPSEDAHQAQLKLLLPKVLSIAGFQSEAKHLSCVSSRDNNNLLELCDIGNPFRSGSTLSLIVLFENDEALYNIDTFSVNVTLATSSEQKNLKYVSYQVLVQVQAKLIIDGYSENEQILFGGKVIGASAVKKPLDAGHYVRHGYEVINNGTSNIGPVILNIYWPYAIKNGKWLFYLLKAEKNADEACIIPSEFRDPLNLLKESYPSTESLKMKREVPFSTAQTKSLERSVLTKSTASSQTTLSCPKTALCVDIICNLGNMTSGKSLFVYVEGIIWNSTFLEEHLGMTDIKVLSRASVSVNLTNVLYADSSILEDVVVTSISSDDVAPPSIQVQWWVIVVSVGAGILLLVFLILVLCKCGFFKRKRDYHIARKHRQASKKADEDSNTLLY